MTLPAYRHGYYFTEIFFLTGLRIFGQKWSGNELDACTLTAPEEIEKQRDAIQAEIDEEAEFRKEHGEIIAHTTNSIEIDASENAIAESSKRLISLNERLYNCLPVIDASYRRNYETFLRKSFVMEMILSELGKGRLEALAENMVIPSELWAGERGVRLYAELNIVVLPRNFSGKRRSLLIFPEETFKKWLSQVPASSEKNEDELSPEELCGRLFDELVSEHRDRPKSKQLIWEEMKEAVPELSRRAFERVWYVKSPESWKKAGAPINAN
jgi:hypothetical protein